ncbi:MULTISPECIES: hypothetical protein [unclassified Brevundimonas]|uniref:hypothetical protein n=1 Tax=unclassified Brevundimonas TaxID=2622653 RepID=UPI000CFB6B55|nr:MULTISPECIES: hypothetical protein [unclassified Brevundimonas]PRA27631.1 hypothetical protein CQ024_11110 [Brevundimonas sp. MYb27]PQZ84416.1 hypothetical protein CQ026_01025 [Brevundimonas sp. MYb31]PRB17649.1 hypothetical protein CQ039_01020 [Brevundimonas sp. MYb52]PRB38022.1 hypothetical protein CQ035_01025 [Brevundimonas sp. MYb46]PRB41988.1 hypothetical protein CQ028_15105 [Brevundimonas sp. MYb33]
MSKSLAAELENQYGAAASESPNGVVMRLLTAEEIDFVSGAGEHAMGFGSSYAQSGPGSFAQGMFSSYAQKHEAEKEQEVQTAE